MQYIVCVYIYIYIYNVSVWSVKSMQLYVATGLSNYDAANQIVVRREHAVIVVIRDDTL